MTLSEELMSAFSTPSGDFSDELDDDSGAHAKAAKDAAFERKQVEEMAKEQAKQVRIWRRNVFILMFLSGTAITLAAYFFLRGEQKEDFETTVRVHKA